MRLIDTLLNKITMYRLALYGLIAIFIWALLMSVLGFLSYNTFSMLGSLSILLVGCYAANTLCAKLFRAPTNVESWIITAFILSLTLAPFLNGLNALWIVLAAVVAMVSKYLIAIRRHHLFNPAALALFVLSVSGIGIATWWVASPVILPMSLVVGLLIVRKVRRFDAFLSFAVTATLVYLAFSLINGQQPLSALATLALSWPIVFLGTVMLTEPYTMPPTRALRIVYGVIVGALFSMHFSFGFIYSTPELALLLGNIYAFAVGSRTRLLLTLKAREELSPGVYEFVFASDSILRFEAGQYIEWTLPHTKADSRGNRRYLSIASEPGAEEVRFATRIAQKGSSFKRALMTLSPGATMSASSLAGDFTLPRDVSAPLVFLVGGIGVTPFASMLRHLLTKDEHRDITIIYAANTPSDFAYKELIERARAIGVKPVYLAGERITEEVIRSAAKDLTAPFFYISGPDIMVRIYRAMLRQMGIPASHIKTDHFAGL